MPTPAVSYARTPTAESHMWAELRALLDGGARRFCDVGGGARPVLSLAQIEKHELEYVVLDVSHAELERTPQGYRQYEASILDRDAVGRLLDDGGRFDAVVSRWTAEHIPDGRAFHEQVFAMLRPGGRAIHFFPTLYSTPFLVNRVLPDALSSRLLLHSCEERQHKFRPYYSWCRGPSERQLKRLRAIGFSVERYTGYFGHNFYAPVKPLDKLQKAFTKRLLERPRPSMTSFALVVLSRPA